MVIPTRKVPFSSELASEKESPGLQLVRCLPSARWQISMGPLRSEEEDVSSCATRRNSDPIPEKKKYCDTTIALKHHCTRGDAYNADAPSQLRRKGSIGKASKRAYYQAHTALKVTIQLVHADLYFSPRYSEALFSRFLADARHFTSVARVLTWRRAV